MTSGQVDELLDKVTNDLYESYGGKMGIDKSKIKSDVKSTFWDVSEYLF